MSKPQQPQNTLMTVQQQVIEPLVLTVTVTDKAGVQQHLKYFDEHTLGNLSPFFDARLFTLESIASPGSIITSAYPKTEVEKAQISERSREEVEAAIRDFFSHIEDG